MPDTETRVGEQLADLIQDVCGDTRDIVCLWTPSDAGFHFNHSFSEFFDCALNDIRDPEAILSRIYPADRPAWRSICGRLARQEVPARPIELRLIGRDSEVRWVRIVLRQLRREWLPDGLIVGTMIDIDGERRIRHKIRVKTFQDNLTGLPNRAMLDYKLQAYMRSAVRNHKFLAFILIDISNFKAVNDRYQYEFGDAVLKTIAAHLTASLPTDATVFRVDGDEFAVLVKNLECWTDVEQIMHLLMRSLCLPVEVGNDVVSISVNAGITRYPGDGATADEIKNHAAIALKKAKMNGPAVWCKFLPEFRQEQIRQYTLEKQLRSAIERKELKLVYQPQIDIVSGRIIGLEALLRWHSAENGLVSPLDFIPVAESSGQIVAIGTWVLENVGQQMRAWLDRGLPIVPVAVNISPVQMKDPNFFSMVRRVLAINRLEPKLLELEITESTFLDQGDQIRQLLEDIRSYGIRVALDDFGSGYSSLTYIRNIALDRLKIDRSFIKDMHERHTDKAIIGTIIVLAHILNLEIVAEGVETEIQFDYLKKIGCNVVQGFLFSKPLPAVQVEDLMQLNAAQAAAAGPKGKQ